MITIEQYAARLGMTAERLLARDKSRELAEARQVYMYYAYNQGLTYDEIGKIIGIKINATRYGVCKVRDMIEMQDYRIMQLLKLLNDDKEEAKA